MCIKLFKRYVCPKTETGALGPDPDEPGLPKRRFQATKIMHYGTEAVPEQHDLGYYVDFTFEKVAEKGLELHVVEKIVECGEPTFNCRDLNSMEERYEDVTKYHCPYCLNIPDFPGSYCGNGIRRSPLAEITNKFDRQQSLRSIEHYLESIMFLTKMSLSCLLEGEEDWMSHVPPPDADQLAGLFFSTCCREHDSHYGTKWWECKCLSKVENYAEASNLGRMLRLEEVNKIGASHSSILNKCRMISDAESDPLDEMKRWAEQINDLWRRMCLTPEERASFWFHPQEDTRFAECVAQLEHEVIRVINDGPKVIEHKPYDKILGAEMIKDWDEGKYTLFVRAMANTIIPMLSWVCYDAGLSNDQVTLIARVLFTLLDHNRRGPRPPITGFADGEQPTLPSTFDDVWSMVYIVCDIPLHSPHQVQLHEKFTVRAQIARANIDFYRQRRTKVIAERTLRLDYAWEILDKRGLSVNEVINLSDRKGSSPPGCSVCAEEYSDAHKLRRPVPLCKEAKHHICARCCLKIVVESEVRSPDIRCVMCRRQCDEWTMLSDRTDRVLSEDMMVAESLLSMVNQGSYY
ncbi:hypothetical protein ACHAQA_002318 [Verticillium albo-atrum]